MDSYKKAFFRVNGVQPRKPSTILKHLVSALPFKESTVEKAKELVRKLEEYMWHHGKSPIAVAGSCLAYFSEQVSFKEIAEEADISRAVIHNHIKKFEEGADKLGIQQRAKRTKEEKRKTKEGRGVRRKVTEEPGKEKQKKIRELRKELKSYKEIAEELEGVSRYYAWKYGKDVVKDVRKARKEKKLSRLKKKVKKKKEEEKRNQRRN